MIARVEREKKVQKEVRGEDDFETPTYGPRATGVID